MWQEVMKGYQEVVTRAEDMHVANTQRECATINPPYTP
jgi:hypothetical protein